MENKKLLSSTNPVSTLSSSAASSKKPKSLSTGLQQKFFLLFARPGVILKVASSQSTTALSLLREEEFLDKTVRVFGTPENPLFLARDVAEWLDYSKNKNGTYKVDVMLNSVDEDEKLVIAMGDNPPFNKGTVLQANTSYSFLTENGLYEVLMLSRKPKAKQFKSKVKGSIPDHHSSHSLLHPLHLVFSPRIVSMLSCTNFSVWQFKTDLRTKYAIKDLFIYPLMPE